MPAVPRLPIARLYGMLRPSITYRQLRRYIIVYYCCHAVIYFVRLTDVFRLHLNIALIPVTPFPTYAQILIDILIALTPDEGVAVVPEACDSQD